MGLFYYTLLYCTHNVSTIILSKLFIINGTTGGYKCTFNLCLQRFFISDIDHTWCPSSTVASYRRRFTVGVCVPSKATADCSGKNRYLMGAGESMIKYHLHMEPLTQGTSPVRNEAPWVSGRHYRGLTRGQLRYCLGFSECESQDLQAFLQAWVFSLQHLWWNKVLLRLPCLSSWFCNVKTVEIKAAFSPTVSPVSPA